MKNKRLGAIYIVRDPRNVISSITHHYSLNYETALEYMLDEKATLMEKSYDEDYSNFTYLNSWANHYKSWSSSNEFKTFLLKFEDLEQKRRNI
jgi:hypothetical protein